MKNSQGTVLIYSYRILFAVLSLLILSCGQDAPLTNITERQTEFSPQIAFAKTIALSDVHYVEAVVTGENIVDTLLFSLAWNPPNYNGTIRVPATGDSWTVTIVLRDASRRKIGQGSIVLDAYHPTATVPVISCQSALPRANAGPDISVGLGESINLHGTATDSFGGAITKWEWKIGSANFIQTGTGDTTITAPLAADTHYVCILRVTDNDGNQAVDTAIVQILQGQIVLAIDSLYGRSAYLRWTKDLSTNFQSYRICHSPMPNITDSDSADTVITDPNCLRYRVGGLTAGSVYHFRVFSHYSNGAENPNNEVMDTTIQVWKTKSPMPTARGALTAAVMNGKLYAIGGQIAGGASCNTMEEYDPALDRWVSKAPMLSLYRNELASCAMGNRIYAMGGLDNNDNSQKDIAAYDIAANAWSLRTPLINSRYGFMANAIGDKIYILCGANWDPVEEYDSAANTVVEKADAPFGVGFRAASCVIGGNIYVIGSKDKDTVFQYVPSNDQWHSKSAFPGALYALTASALNDRIFTFGGQYESGGTPQSQVWEYNPAADTSSSGSPWIQKSPMPTARSYSASGTINGKIYVVGGLNGSQSVATVEEYDPAMDK